MIVKTAASVCALARQNRVRDPSICLNLKRSPSSGFGQKSNRRKTTNAHFRATQILRSAATKALEAHLKTATQTT
jgi:hypothetical protein